MARTRTAPPTTQEHPADLAVRLRDCSSLPTELHATHAAILQAFDRYEAGDDDGAKTALQLIGLQSPFLEWKLLLRGLMAYSAGDDSRALENWQRLAGNRLPARLAAPLRAMIDPEFKRSQTKEVVSALERQLDLLTGDNVQYGLRQIRTELSRDRSLKGAFYRAEQLMPALRERNPHLCSRLANCFYRAILNHGEPADLPRYRKVFGSPPDDPEFHRLEALAREEARDIESANQRWSAYEKWLGSNPPGWPADLVRRTRAMINLRMATNIAMAANSPDHEFQELMSSFFGRSQVQRRKSTPPDPVPLLRRAVEQAPDWETPARILFDRLMERDKGEEAEQVALQLLEHNPIALNAIDALAARFSETGRASQALNWRLKALAANPLDKTLRVHAAYATIGAARRLAIDGAIVAAEQTLNTGRSLCEENTPTGYLALQSVLARKAGRIDDAARYRDLALAVPNGRLAASFFLAVDAGLLKLKPADKRAAEQELATALANPSTAVEASLLYGAWDMYFLEGITYRGQKTQEKKIHTLILQTPSTDGPTTAFEVLAQSVATRNEWKLTEKLAGLLRVKFPENPTFPLLLAECEFAKADGMPRPTRVARYLRDALKLAERSTETRHRELLDRIRQLQEEISHPMFFDNFF